MRKTNFPNKIKAHPLSATLQIVICLLYLSVIAVALLGSAIPGYWRWILFGLAIALTIVQCYRLKCPLLLIDRIFAFKPGKQLILAIFAFFISMDFGLCLFPSDSLRHVFIGFVSYQHVVQDPNESIRYESEKNKDVERYFIAKNPPKGNKKDIFFRNSLWWILGMIVFNGLLIATITRYMSTRADKFKQGANTYRNIKHHYIIIGYGNLCVPIIRNILRRADYDESSYFLLLTNQNTEAIRRSLDTQLQSADEKVVIYSGDMNSKSHLSRLNIGDALEVFILGEGQEPSRDSLNLECAKYIKEIRAPKLTGKVLHVNVQLDKPNSYSTIKRITIPRSYYMEGDREVTYLRPFNFYENWSRLLWGTYHLDCYRPLDQGRIIEVDDSNTLRLAQKHVHLIIVGFDEMGTALLLEALRLCHYPNYNEITGDNKTLITVVDPKMSLLLPRFEAQYSYLSQIKDVEVEFKAGNIEDPDVRMMVEALANRDDVLLTVAICLHDSDASLSAALTLPESVYYHVVDRKIVKNDTAQVLVRQEIRKGLADLLDEENGKFSNVKIFGTLDKGINDELLDDLMAKCVGATYHCKYDLNPPFDFFELAEKDWDKALQIAESNWGMLNEDKRFANRYQVEIYKTYQSYRKLLDMNPELLYQTEHMRWSAERSVAGYRNMSEEWIKSDAYQIHRLIVPYHDLDELEKSKDKNVLLLMDKVLSLQKHN